MRPQWFVASVPSDQGERDEGYAEDRNSRHEYIWHLFVEIVHVASPFIFSFNSGRR
jgi:hypothetical protein